MLSANNDSSEINPFDHQKYSLYQDFGHRDEIDLIDI